MQRSTPKVLVMIGFASALAACGDDSTSGVSDGQTTGDSGTESAPSTMSATTAMSTSVNTDSVSGESSGTGDATDGTDGGTTGGSGGETDSPTGGTTEGDTGATTMASTGATGDETGEEDTGEQEVCEAPGMLMPCDAGTDDPFQAMGLNCGGMDPNTHIPIVNEIFTSVDPAAWRIATQLGTHINPGTGLPQWSPREGDSFLVISSGRFPDPDAMGVLELAAGAMQNNDVDNSNPDGVGAASLPAPISPSEGSNNGAGGTPFINCDGVNDCSDSLWGQWTAGSSAANDMLWFQFETPVPGGTHGFSFDFVYFSAEFPEWVDTQFNDIFAVWSSSETYTGNLCFVNDEPCTVTALSPSVSFLAGAPELDGTGFDGVGESTDWFSAQGSAEPGEDLLLTFIIFDMGDSFWDTAVILDNFQWDCEGCVPSEVDPCIGIDPV